MEALKKLLDLIYENSCVVCKKGSGKQLVCINCESSFIRRELNYLKELESVTVYSWGMYEGKLRDAIIELKLGKKKLAKYFADILSNFWKELKTDFSEYVVIPVPSHKKRIRERGYCQTSLIALDFAIDIGATFSHNFVKRVKETEHMNKLQSLDDRRKNIKDAFFVSEQTLQNRNTLIIDDILTSGSTMNELARSIKKQYPDTKIIGLTIASGDTYN